MHVPNKSVAMSGSGEASPRWAGGSGTTLSHLRADGAATANNAGGKTQCTGQQRLGAWGVKGKFVYFKGVFSLWISLLTPRFLLQAVPQRCRENHCSFCKQAASARLPKEHQEEISENVLLSRSGLMSSYCNWAMTACVVFAVSSLVQSAQSAPGGYGLDFHGEMPRAWSSEMSNKKPGRPWTLACSTYETCRIFIHWYGCCSFHYLLL